MWKITLQGPYKLILKNRGGIKMGKEGNKTILGEILDWAYCIILAVLIAVLVKNLVFSTTIVRQTSMVPTLKDGDILLVNRLAQVTGKPLERGDIVIIEAPDGSKNENGTAYYSENNFLTTVRKLFIKTFYVKRVVGLPGEHLVIDGDDVYINGEKIEETYTNPDREKYPPYYDQEIDIPEGYVFCMGDNRDSSKDSRYLGLIPVNKVEGKTNFRLFPFDKFGNIE